MKGSKFNNNELDVLPVLARLLRVCFVDFWRKHTDKRDKRRQINLSGSTQVHKVHYVQPEKHRDVPLVYAVLNGSSLGNECISLTYMNSMQA
jgi:hypothetical protein